MLTFGRFLQNFPPCRNVGYAVSQFEQEVLQLWVPNKVMTIFFGLDVDETDKNFVNRTFHSEIALLEEQAVPTTVKDKLLHLSPLFSFPFFLKMLGRFPLSGENRWTTSTYSKIMGDVKELIATDDPKRCCDIHGC